jgi:hypothetical protein
LVVQWKKMVLCSLKNIFLIILFMEKRLRIFLTGVYNSMNDTLNNQPKQMKQLKSNSQDLRNLFTQNITVRHIAEDLKYCNVETGAEVVREYMEKEDFDVLGIEEDSLICGYVEKSELKTGKCGNFKQIFSPPELIAESTPLTDLLLMFKKKSRMFILDGNQVKGIVTCGDLQKAPVRMFLFGLITLLEMQMLRVIQLWYPDETWKQILTSGSRLGKAEELLKERKERNEAIDLADCLQFCDKRDIVLKTPQLFINFDFTNIKDGKRFFKEAEELRNNLAHAQDIIAGSTWEKVIDLVEEIETTLIKCEEIGF